MSPAFYFSFSIVTLLMYVCYLGMLRNDSGRPMSDDRIWEIIGISLASLFVWPVVQAFWIGRMFRAFWYSNEA